MDITEYMLPCPSKKFFGIECFGCGFQRALMLVFEGKFYEAWVLYPAIYGFIVFGVFIGLHFLDKKRNYEKFIISSAFLSVFIMLFSYIYKKIVLF